MTKNEYLLMVHDEIVAMKCKLVEFQNIAYLSMPLKEADGIGNVLSHVIDEVCKYNSVIDDLIEL